MSEICRSSALASIRLASGWLGGMALLALQLPALAGEPASATDSAKNGASPEAILEEVAGIVRQDFYDPELRGVPWDDLTATARARVAEDAANLAPAIRDLLAALDTSHTSFHTAEEPTYYQLAGIFQASLEESFPERFAAAFGERPVRYPGIGITTELVDGEAVVRGVLEGSPAHDAGLLVGDVLLTADGAPYRPVASFRGKVGQPVALTLRRRAESPELTVEVTPRSLDASKMFLDAMKASAEVIEVELEGRSHSVAYVHAWSYAGAEYQELLESLLLTGGALAAADALVLDLRDGWGGASPAYLRLFLDRVPVLTMIDRKGTRRDFDPQWRKPVVLLVDERTRSGKEALAFGFRRYRLGPVVGSRTAGAVTAGRATLLADGSLLFLAVADVLVDGERLEGVGVTPDIEVPFPRRYAQGRDPQRSRALLEAARRAQSDLQNDGP